MSNTDQAPDPTMEEILSSIRRIISDDNEAPPPEETSTKELEDEQPAAEEMPAAEPAPETDAGDETLEVADEDEDIFELTNVVDGGNGVEDEVPAGSLAEMDQKIEDFGAELADSGADVADDIEFVNVEENDEEELDGWDLAEEPEPEPAPAPKIEPVAVAAPEPVVFNEEVPDRLVSDDAGLAAAASFGDLANTILSRGNSASTLEELVQEMLRPMLKSWLDTNLPPLVEKLVREEIERIARRGR